MGKKGAHDHTATAGDVRARAEARLAAEGWDAANAGCRDPLALVHELQVHQIELEMQNEELRRAQLEAHELREKYQELYEFAPVGYLTLDERETILEANLVGATLLGCSRRELLRRPLARYFDPGVGIELERFFRRLVARGEREQCEAPVVGEEETRVWLLLEGEAVTTAAGKKVFRVALVDITDRKRAEEEIVRLNAELEERAGALETSNRDLEAFGYTVTHDLRRPLTRVYSAAQLLKELYGQAGEECLRMVSIVTTGCRDMEAVLTAVFNLSRSTSVPLKRRLTDLSRVAHDIAAELQLSDTRRKARFVIPEAVIADCDPDLMRIVLDNLLGNAWKYTASRDEAVIEFGMAELGGTTRYFVRDNGVGFAPAEAASLFQPFHRAAGGGEFIGHGIGLATVRKVIERHGGGIRAEGVPGLGATFFFTLPEEMK